MRVLEAGDWCLLLPDEWQAEREEDSIVVFDRDEVGCIELSELRKDGGSFDDADIADLTGAEPGWKPAERGDFRGVGRSLVEDDAAIREWYLHAGDLLLYVTYSCEMENQGMDDAAVDEILDTLQVVAE